MLEFIIITMLTIGPAVVAEQNAKGNLPAAPAACKVEHVKAVGGGYGYRHVIDDGKGCTFSG